MSDLSLPWSRCFPHGHCCAPRLSVHPGPLWHGDGLWPVPGLWLAWLAGRLAGTGVSGSPTRLAVPGLGGQEPLMVQTGSSETPLTSPTFPSPPWGPFILFSLPRVKGCPHSLYAFTCLGQSLLGGRALGLRGWHTRGPGYLGSLARPLSRLLGHWSLGQGLFLSK